MQQLTIEDVYNKFHFSRYMNTYFKKDFVSCQASDLKMGSFRFLSLKKNKFGMIFIQVKRSLRRVPKHDKTERDSVLNLY